MESVPGTQEPSLYFSPGAWTLGTQNPPRQSSLGVKSSQPGSFIKLKMVSLPCISPLASPFPISTHSDAGQRLLHHMQLALLHFPSMLEQKALQDIKTAQTNLKCEEN